VVAGAGAAGDAAGVKEPEPCGVADGAGDGDDEAAATAGPAAMIASARTQ
jgi:hypothetical protein